MEPFYEDLHLVMMRRLVYKSYAITSILIIIMYYFEDIQLRLVDAVVRAGLSATPTDNIMCGNPVTTDQALSKDWIAFTCDPPVQARFVSVDIPGSAILTLCEVQVSTCDLQPPGKHLTLKCSLKGKYNIVSYQIIKLTNYYLKTYLV